MNVLIVGYGSIAAKHTNALKKLSPDTNIFALRSDKSSLEYDGVVSLYDWDEIKCALDFIIISNPTKYHVEAILKAASFSVPLFIEKPVLSDLADVDEVSKRISENALTTYIACNLRFHPCIVYLKNHLKGKRINEVNVYCGSNLALWRPGQDYTKSYSSSAAQGGGVHLDLIHEVDYCYWLFGQPDEFMGIRRKVSDLKIDSFDFAAYHLTYPHFTVNIVLNYYRKTSKRVIELVTEEGEFFVDLLACSIKHNGTMVFYKPEFQMSQTYEEQMDYFLKHIRGGTNPMNNFEEALEVLKIALK